MKSLCLFLFTLVSAISFAQKAEEALSVLYKKYPQEKVVLQYSKNEFLAGETIFFKAYVLSGYEPSTISTNLYTELYDQNKKVIAQQIVPLFNAAGAGSFVLPASLAEGVYYLRAYTKYMLNFDEGFQYIRPINVYNEASMYRLAPKPVQWTAKAFVEGGVLLDDVPALVAVRLFATGSSPQSWQGSLLEKETNLPVADVRVFNSEIGEVRFLPSASKSYVITIKDNLGNTQSIDVPKVSTKGTSLLLWSGEEKFDYTIFTKNIPGNGSGYKLVGSINDQFVFSASIKKSSGAVRGEINISEMPTGVLRVTLFDENEKPLNEALCFLHQSIEPVEPALKIDSLSFAAKGLNQWQVKIDTTTWASYLVQVSDVSYPVTENFLGDLYLQSDFKQPIQQVNWYFQEVDDNKKAALHALLAAEKSERFQWTDILQGRFPVIHQKPDKYLSYSATVFKGNKLQRLREMNLVFKGKDAPIQVVQVRSDTSGRFQLDEAIFLDTIHVFYQPISRKFLEKDVEIDFRLLNKFVPYNHAFPFSAYEIVLRKNNDILPPVMQRAASQRRNELTLKEKEKIMEEVIIRTKAKTATEELDKKLSSGLFASSDATIFDFVNESQNSSASYTNILQWLEGRIPGYRTEMQDGQVVPFLRNAPTQLYIDEIAVSSDFANSLSVADIAMIKVIRGAFMGGGLNGGNGAIAIYTRRGDMASRSTFTSMLTNILVGYPRQAPFFSPVYNEVTTSVSDQREILFYTSVLYPEDGNSSTIRFYNNDKADKFRLQVIGFTAAGELVYLNKIIKP